jgi:hypothetical protein
MKNNKLYIILLIIIAIASAFAVLPTHQQYSGPRTSVTSVQRSGEIVASVTADAADPNFAEKTWTNAMANFTAIPAEWGIVTLSFYGYGDGTGDGDPNDATFSYDVYVVDIWGGYEAVTTGSTGTIGAMKLSHNPATGAALTDPNSSYRWCDDLNEGTKKTTSVVSYSDYESTNGLAKQKWDRHSAFGIYVRIYNMTAQPVTSVNCIMNGFNH